MGATDILLKPAAPPIFRVRGALVSEGVAVSRAALLQFHAHLVPQGMLRDAGGAWCGQDARLECRGRYRVHAFMAEGEVCMAVRVVDDDVRSLEALGLPSALASCVRQGKGLNLITGKTGSGKSTTMAALAQHLLWEEAMHVVTLEDPIELLLKNGRGQATQRELGRDFPSFEQGIHEALRQSPDFILVGEMRTLGSVRAALAAAESGHGVIGTLHSVGAARTLGRVLSLVQEGEKEFMRHQLAEHLNLVLSQKLIHEGEDTWLDYELMLKNTAIENIIREGRLNQIDNMLVLGEKQGMRRFKI